MPIPVRAGASATTGRVSTSPLRASPLRNAATKKAEPFDGLHLAPALRGGRLPYSFLVRIIPQHLLRWSGRVPATRGRGARLSRPRAAYSSPPKGRPHGRACAGQPSPPSPPWWPRAVAWCARSAPATGSLLASGPAPTRRSPRSRTAYRGPAPQRGVAVPAGGKGGTRRTCRTVPVSASALAPTCCPRRTAMQPLPASRPLLITGFTRSPRPATGQMTR